MSSSLKNRILKGSFFLTLRQLLASGFSLVSTFVIARILGSESYGIVSTALGIFYFLRWTSRFGLGAYLIQKPDLMPEDAEQALAFYITCGGLLCMGFFFLAPGFGLWTGRTEVTHALQVLAIAVWLDLISNVSINLMTRELRFGEISGVEAIAQTANYTLSVGLVLIYKSYWGPILGTVLQMALLAILSYRCYPVRWRLRWRWAQMRPALSFGTSYYFASWLFNLRALVIPLLMSRLAGVEAVGITNIALRMVRQLMLLRHVFKRMSMSIMTKLLGDAGAVRRALTQGMMYQALLMGTTCALFACVATWIIPLIFGPEWLPSAQLAPLIGLSTAVGAVFDLHIATLYVANRNRTVIIHNLSYATVLWTASWFLIPQFEMGGWGYVIAELLSLPTYYLVHRAVKEMFGSPQYTIVALLMLASLLPSLASLRFSPLINMGIFVICYSALITFSPKTRQLLTGTLELLKRGFKPNLST